MNLTPRFKARLAGIFYLLTFLGGGLALVVRGKVGVAAGLIAGACYLAVTLLFYDLFKPVSRRLSLIAAAVSLVGIAAGPLQLKVVNPLVFFGFYCLLIGYLIFRSTFLPRILGPLMAFASLGWLSFVSPELAKGVDAPRWREQAGAAKVSGDPR